MDDEFKKQVLELAVAKLVKDPYFVDRLVDHVTAKIVRELTADGTLKAQVIEATTAKLLPVQTQQLLDAIKSAVERQAAKEIGPVVAQLAKQFATRLLDDPKEPEKFKPDWASHPGASLKDLLTERGISYPEALGKMSSYELFSYVLEEVVGASVTPGMAAKFESLGWGTADFWLQREADYRAALARGAKP